MAWRFNPFTKRLDYYEAATPATSELPWGSVTGKPAVVLTVNGVAADEAGAVTVPLGSGWDGAVTAFADLPAAADHSGETYRVGTSTGVWLINRKSAGFYLSNGAAWAYLGDYPASYNSLTDLPTIPDSPDDIGAAPALGTDDNYVTDAEKTAIGNLKNAAFKDVGTTAGTVMAGDTEIPAAYTHPSGDGNLHVPATSTTNSGKVLTAGGTAGALTWETPAAGGGKFKIALSPGSAELVGSADEPLLVGVASASADYTHWTELRYNDTTANEAIWTVGSVMTKDYAGGNITARLRWIAAAIAGDVKWQVRLAGRTSGEIIDVAFDATSHTVATTVAGTTLQINTSEITLTPGAAELTAGDTWWIAIKRLPADATDTMVGDAKLIDAGVFEI